MILASPVFIASGRRPCHTLPTGVINTDALSALVVILKAVDDASVSVWSDLLLHKVAPTGKTVR